MNDQLLSAFGNKMHIINPYRYGGVMKFSDTFTDTNSVLLVNHTPDIDTVGGGWVAQNGAFDIQSNKASGSTAPGSEPHIIATIETNQADVIIQSDIGLNADNAVRIILRYVDNDNFWLCQSKGGVSDTMQIFERTSGSYQLRATGIHTDADEDVTYTVTANGTTITFTSPTQSINYASATAHQTATIHGIGAIVTGHTHDNFTIDPV